MRCPKCEKPEGLCMCAEIQPLKSKLRVLILQHPQEPKEVVGTARMAQLALPKSVLKVGLSWPNLQKALGEPIAQNANWAVLYLGSGVKGPYQKTAPAVFVNKKGEEILQGSTPLHGIVILDGTWSQAKAIWWRNAWLLKLRRVVLNPSKPSQYGSLRKEPRKECLSTLESIAAAFEALGERPETSDGLRLVFTKFIKKYRAGKKLRQSGRRGQPSGKPEQLSGNQEQLSGSGTDTITVTETDTDTDH